MKLAILVAALICLSVPPHPSAGDQKYCKRQADVWAKWVIESQTKLAGDQRLTDQVQLQLAQEQEFNDVVDRMSARATLLLDKDLSEKEVKVDLYALCMSIT